MSSILNTETARISELIRQEQFGEVESIWGEAVEKAPTEIDIFLGLAETLLKTGHGEKAGNLLEQLVHKLDELGELAKAIDVIGEIARVAPRNPRQRELAEGVFSKAFADLDGYEKCVERAEEEAKGSDNRFVSALFSQLTFQPGDWLFHDAGWGLGQVTRINAESGRLHIDFEEKKDHTVKLGAAAKFFKKLPPESIVVQRTSDPKGLKQRCKDDGESILLTVLKSHRNRSTLKRIKAELVPFAVDTKHWAKWWLGVRKQLAKHEYIKLGTGTNPTIERLVTAMTLEDETRESFDNARKLLDRLVIVRRYLKDSEKGEARAELLAHVGACLREHEPTSEAEKFVIDFLIADLKRAERGLELESPYDAAELAADAELLLEHLVGISDTEYRQRALNLHQDRNESTWPNLFSLAFLLFLPNLWDGIAKKLTQGDHEVQLVKALRAVQATPEKYPLQYLWFAKRAILGGDLPAKLEVPEADKIFGRLVWVANKVLTQIERGHMDRKDILATLRTAMTERSSRMMVQAIEGMDAERAAHLMHEIKHSRVISETHNAGMRDLLQKTFPDVKGLAAEEVQLDDDEETGEILATQGGRRQREEELRRIQEDELPEVAKLIGDALEMGDISENAELEAARERESRLKEHAKEIIEELIRVRVIDLAEIDASHAGFGTQVTLEREDGKQVVYTIYGRYEADHEQNIISIESPIAQGILGRGPGEEAEVITPEGSVQYRVVSVEAAS